MAMVKAKDLVGKTNDELEARVKELSKEAMNLRFQQTSGQLKNTSRHSQVRREIAQIKTVLNQRANGKKENK